MAEAETTYNELVKRSGDVIIEDYSKKKINEEIEKAEKLIKEKIEKAKNTKTEPPKGDKSKMKKVMDTMEQIQSELDSINKDIDSLKKRKLDIDNRLAEIFSDDETD